MAIVTKTIGTNSRDYSTITGWEAQLDNGAIFSADDIAIGECYNDDDFDEAVTLNGGGTIGLREVKLSVAATDRHDGSAGTGARILCSTTRMFYFVNNAPRNIIWEWLEVDENDNGGSSYPTFNIYTPAVGDNLYIVRNMLFHDWVGTNYSYGIGLGSTRNLVINNIVYNVGYYGTSTRHVRGIDHEAYADGDLYIANNTVHRIVASGAGNVNCYYFRDLRSTHWIYNNIGTYVSTVGGGSGCFNDTDVTVAQAGYNLSSDGTATGTGSLTNKDPDNQYVSTVFGSEDLRLKSGADAIGAGYDFGTSPSGINIDISGNDRDALGVDWDIGADQYIAAGQDAYQVEGVKLSDLIDSLLTINRNLIEAVKLSDSYVGTVGGQTHQVSLIESTKLSDVYTYLLTTYGSQSESVKLSDVYDVFRTLGADVSESIKLSDVYEGILTTVGSVTESIKFSDLYDVFVTLQANAVESIKLSDLYERLIHTLKSISESVSFGDDYVGTILANLEVAENIKLSDLVTAVSALIAEASENIELQDTLSKLLTVRPSDVQSGKFSDTLSATITTLQQYQENIKLSDSFSVISRTIQSVGEEARFSDLFTANVFTALSVLCENASKFSDLYETRLVGQARITDGLKLSDDYTVRADMTKALAEGLVMGDSWAASLVAALSQTEGVVLSDAYEALKSLSSGIVEGSKFSDQFIGLVSAASSLSDTAVFSDLYTTWLSASAVKLERVLLSSTFRGYVSTSSSCLDGFVLSDLYEADRTRITQGDIVTISAYFCTLNEVSAYFTSLNEISLIF